MTPENFFNENGYWISPTVITRNECTEIAHTHLNASRVGDRSLLEQSWCLDLSQKLKEYLISDFPSVRKLRAVQCTLFQKHKNQNWLVAWHQDRSIPTGSHIESSQKVRNKNGQSFCQPKASVLSRVVSVRLSIDSSHEGNGGLRVIPKSHQSGILSPKDIVKTHRNTDAITPEVPCGSVMLLKPLLVHASSKSKSDENRRVLHFVFMKDW